MASRLWGRLRHAPILSGRYGREAMALISSKVEELDGLPDEALERLIEEPFEAVATGPSGETYEVTARGYAGKGIPEDEPDIFILVEASRTGDRPPYLIEGEIGRFKDPEMRQHNWTAFGGMEATEGLGVGTGLGCAILLAPWVAGVVFLATRFL